MRRRPAGGSGSGGGGGRLDGALDRFLGRHPKFFVWVSVGLGALIIVGLAMSRGG